MHRIIQWAGIAAIAFTLAACGGGEPTAKSEPALNFQVGRTSIEWTDTTRNEQCGGAPAGSGRRLQAYVWYPAQPAAGTSKQPLLSDAQVSLLAQGLGATTESLKRLPSNSFANAPMDMRRKDYPVLLMSHSAGGSSPLFYASTAEFLASKGYVVVGLSHTYQALATFFADGSITPLDPACDPLGGAALIGPAPTFADFNANWRFSVELDSYLTQDIASAQRHLIQLNVSSPIFAQRLQMNRVGVFGHSFGGSHAFRAARELPGIAAVANLDGTVFNDDAFKGASKPYLLMNSPEGNVSPQASVQAISELQALGLTMEQATLVFNRGQPGTSYLASSPAYRVTIGSAQHQNFSDVGLWPAYGIPKDAFPVNLADASAILELQNSLLASFFDKHLRGLSVEFVLPSNALKGVVLERRP